MRLHERFPTLARERSSIGHVIFFVISQIFMRFSQISEALDQKHRWDYEKSKARG